MTKPELLKKVQSATKGRLSRERLAKLVDFLFEEVERATLRDGRFAYPGFGTFVVRRRRARAGHNPRTKEPMTIAATTSIGFRPSVGFKKELEAARKT